MFGPAEAGEMRKAWLLALCLFGAAVAAVTLAAQWLWSHVSIAIH